MVKARDAKSTDEKLGLKFRIYTCIKAGGRRAGTLTVGMADNPRNDNKVKKKLIAWAQRPNSKLVQYIQRNFDLGGPSVSSR